MINHPEFTTSYRGLKTVPEIIQSSIEQYGSNKSLGFRQTIKEVELLRPVHENGKLVQKPFKTIWKGDYQWRTYQQLGEEIKSFGSGLVGLGIKPGTRIGLFATTRSENNTKQSKTRKFHLVFINQQSKFYDLFLNFL